MPKIRKRVITEELLEGNPFLRQQNYVAGQTAYLDDNKLKLPVSRPVEVVEEPKAVKKKPAKKAAAKKQEVKEEPKEPLNPTKLKKVSRTKKDSKDETVRPASSPINPPPEKPPRS